MVSPIRRVVRKPRASLVQKLFAFAIVAAPLGYGFFYVGRDQYPENKTLMFVGAIMLCFPALIAASTATILWLIRRKTGHRIIHCVTSGCLGEINIREVVLAETCPACRNRGTLFYDIVSRRTTCRVCQHWWKLPLRCPSCGLDLGPLA